jgi:mannose-6-phosphate isomerase-like protein (cupin superfamily)
VHVITASEAPTFALEGVTFTGYAAPSRGSAGLCAWQIRVAGDLYSGSAHLIDQDEVFMVTAGRIKLAPDGPALAAGDCAVVPAGTPIQLINPDPGEATAYVAIRAGFHATSADGTPIGTPPWAR